MADSPRTENDGERILLSHLLTFGFLYPAEKDKVPASVIDELMDRCGGAAAGSGVTLCQRGNAGGRRERWGCSIL